MQAKVSREFFRIRMLLGSIFNTDLRRIAPLHKANNTATALFDFHQKRGGKIVDFGGYALPLVYSDQSHLMSHIHTRAHASLFDVSHMLQTYLHGKDAIACFETVCTADLQSLAPGCGTLTVFTNDTGGILDDLVVMKLNDSTLYVVSNAAMRQQDKGIIDAAVMHYRSEKKDVSVKYLSPNEQSLIALQGPKAVPILAKLLPSKEEINRLYFMQSIETEICGIRECRVTRCGYTGEDGVEISVDSTHVQKLVDALFDIAPKDELKMAGLAVRDSLRLEAGLCLYGTDIDVNVSPVEASLSWLVARRRRNEMNFPGATHILSQLKEGVKMRRVGFEMMGSNMPAARAKVQIYHNGNVVGKITSGGPSPTLSKNIGMGYIEDRLRIPSTPVQLKIRDKFYDATVSKMPFVKTNYYLKQ